MAVAAVVSLAAGALGGAREPPQRKLVSGSAPLQQRLRKQHPAAATHSTVAAAAAAGASIGRWAGTPLGAAHLGAPPAELQGPALAAAVKEAFLESFWGMRAAPRVLDSFRRLQTGREFEQHWPGLGLQRASSYMEGLSATPFPDPHGGAYRWLEAVEAAAPTIMQEFREVTADGEGLAAKGNNIWVPAARQDALLYGPKWRTLVLQDRGHWEPTNSQLFPCTTKVFQDLNAPTLEVFFARQEAGTGIESHTDYVNFIQTTHLGLDIPEGDCWIKVGEHTKKWQEGKVVVCDTSFMHETRNNTERDRYVLIMRHWHPEVATLERHAVEFLFECFDNPTPEGIKGAQRRAAALGGAGAGTPGGGGKGRSKKVKKAAGGSTGFGGFGKK